MACNFSEIFVTFSCSFSTFAWFFYAESQSLDPRSSLDARSVVWLSVIVGLGLPGKEKTPDCFSFKNVNIFQFNYSLVVFILRIKEFVSPAATRWSMYLQHDTGDPSNWAQLVWLSLYMKCDHLSTCLLGTLSQRPKPQTFQWFPTVEAANPQIL